MKRTKILAKALAQNEIKEDPEKNNILTNDPSMTAWGWAVLSPEGKVLDSGCIKTTSGGKKRRIRKGDETVHRVCEINQKLLEIIHKYKVNYMLSELPHGSQNASAAVMIGVVVGIAQTLSDALGIGIEFYSEGDSKKCALGKRAAEKIEMVNCMKTHYEGWYKGTKYIDEAVADALAVHYVASKESSILKLYKTNNENGKI